MIKTIAGTLLVALSLSLGTPAVQAGPFDSMFFSGGSRICLSGNGAIRRAIQEQGYSNVYLNVQNGRYIESRATKGKWVYLLDVDACSGRVYDRKRLRPA